MFPSRINKLKLILSISVLGFSQVATAERADRSQPIIIEADTATVDQLNQNMIYTGNVLLSQGTLHITADRISATQNASGQQRAQATGKPATFKQKMDAPTPKTPAEWVEGHAQTLEYDSHNATVRLTGNAYIKRGADTARGHFILYEAQTGLFQVKNRDGKQGSGRVSITLQPRSAAQ